MRPVPGEVREPLSTRHSEPHFSGAERPVPISDWRSDLIVVPGTPSSLEARDLQQPQPPEANDERSLVV